MSKPHAIHNEAVCDFLRADGNYNDWVITTAFYSAIHYVEHQIFPLVIGTTTHNSFNSYYDAILKSRRVSKHNGKLSLVKSTLTCGAQYRWLMDACMNSRYTNYIVTPEEATMAKECLDLVKATITKP